MSLEAAIAANRFGLGARVGELRAAQGDPRGWLAAQVRGQREMREMPELIRALPSSADVFEAFAKARDQRRAARKSAQLEGELAEGELAQNVAAAIRKTLRPAYLDQVAARYRVAMSSEESFRERLVHFWTNHFAVSADKPALLALAGTLENEAIRPNVTGRFADMLLAAETHPAMILYLDNQASVGPNSLLAQRASKRPRNAERKIGINENLAREILELHTLGVNGGYTQADVTAFAQALTGWSIGGGEGRLKEGEVGKFEFRDNAHEPGAKHIVGKRYGEHGMEQGRAVLRNLAEHPATAIHLATKLVRHFVADNPPRDAVDRVARAYRDSQGDLPTVYRAVIELPQAWAQPLAKFKTPHDFIVSAFRMIGVVPAKPQQITAPFQLLGQRPYTPGSPAGWPDTADRWDGPDALLKRIEWSTAAGERLGSRYEPLELASQSLGECLSDHSRVTIARAASAAQGITLLLASPEFQRR